jgi:hypothetical protein
MITNERKYSVERINNQNGLDMNGGGGKENNMRSSNEMKLNNVEGKYEKYMSVEYRAIHLKDE